MRIVCVILPGSPHSIRHLNALVEAGWDVHAALAFPGKLLPGLDPEITVHQPPSPMESPRVRHTLASGLMNRLMPGRAIPPGAGRTLVKGRQGRRRFRRGQPAISLGSNDSLPASFPDERLLPGSYNVDHAQWLAALVDTLRPNLIHSFTIQQAGFVTFGAKLRCQRPFPPWIVSNWGIDIHLFVDWPDQRNMVEAILGECDYYTAECDRDVALARMLGFGGTVLDVLPIGGGFDVQHLRHLRQPGPTSARRLIMVKGYQGPVGRGLVALQAIRRAADALVGYEIAIYSCHPDLNIAAQLLQADTGLRVTILPHLPYDELMRNHGRARIGLGLSTTDGTSTSALESMIMGAFPIQSDTSCLDEWIIPGETGFLVHPEEPDDVANALRRAVEDDALIDAAVRANDRTVDRRLDARFVNPMLRAMYRRVLDDSQTPGRVRGTAVYGDDPRLCRGHVRHP